jgi:carbon storage regulator CsrA
MHSKFWQNHLTKDGIIKENEMETTPIKPCNNGYVTALTISRNQGQSFKIGDEVTVEIQKIEGKRVSVRIYAPKFIKVLRSEIYNRVID